MGLPCKKGCCQHTCNISTDVRNNWRGRVHNGQTKKKKFVVICERSLTTSQLDCRFRHVLLIALSLSRTGAPK